MHGRVSGGVSAHADVEKLHRTIAKATPYQAHRTIAVLSKMLSLAVKWEMRTDNPARGIERAPCSACWASPTGWASCRAAWTGR